MADYGTPGFDPDPKARQKGSRDDKLIRSNALLAITNLVLFVATAVLALVTIDLQDATSDLVNITRCESYQSQHHAEGLPAEASDGPATGTTPCTDPTRIKQ